jgi:DNA topoisomerase VI subunit A
MTKIFQLKHERIQVAKPEAEKILNSGNFEIPRLSVDIINNRWRAYQKGEGNLHTLEPEVAKIVKAALEAIVMSDIIMDQRDVYYSLRGKHPDWKISGHPLDTIQAYDTFVGQIMEKLQLVTGYTMQSLGVRAGPRGYITGDDTSYFKLPSGLEIKISASPALKFNLVDEGVEFISNARKLIHYEKQAGMDALLISDIPVMIESVFMTSAGYSVEAATKLHADMERRGLPLWVLGDSDPHGMSMQLMYGRASKSNAYMPDSFYPKKAKLLGLFPRVAEELGLPPEKITAEHQKILPNLRKLIEETRPEHIGDVEIFEKKLLKWEWQALSAQDQYAPAIYMIESLYAKGDEIKFVPDSKFCKEKITNEIKAEINRYVEDQIDCFARKWLMENLKPKLVEQIRNDLSGDIQAFDDEAEQQLEILRNMSDEDLREAIKLKLVKQPKQYWNNAVWKVIDDVLSKKFTIVADVKGDVSTEGTSRADTEVTISQPEVPEQPLQKIDIITAIEKRVTGKNMLIQKIRNAIQKVLGKPSEVW